MADGSKFRKVSCPKGNPLRKILNKELEIRPLIKTLFDDGRLSKNTYNKLWPVGSHPGILYGLPKVHKDPVNNFPKFRPILSAIGTPAYALAKYLVPFFNPICTNEYTIKDSFSFSSEIAEHDNSLYMCSLDVESLFTNIPLIETINICTEEIFKHSVFVNDLNKQQFKNLLTLSTKDTFLCLTMSITNKQTVFPWEVPWGLP